MNVQYLNKNGRWTKSALSYKDIPKAIDRDWGTH